MEVRLNNSELTAKVEQWVIATGHPADTLIEDAVTGYFAGLVQVGAMLDSRYDDLKGGAVEPIDGDEALGRLLENTKAQRTRSA